MSKHVGLWSKDQLKRTVAEIKEGMSANRAYNKLKIPRRTLRSHMKTGESGKSYDVTAYVFKPEQERKCVQKYSD
jgi:hypothetical protein